jgi:hypothetical protein
VTTIYGLVDPRSDKVRYVGRSIDVSTRFAKHVQAPQTPPMKAWIAALAEDGLKPVLRVLDVCADEESDIVETRWIRDLRASGVLLNFSKMGRGAKRPGLRPIAVTVEEEGPSARSTAFLAEEAPAVLAAANLPPWAQGLALKLPAPPPGRWDCCKNLGRHRPGVKPG